MRRKKNDIQRGIIRRQEAKSQGKTLPQHPEEGLLERRVQGLPCKGILLDRGREHNEDPDG